MSKLSKLITKNDLDENILILILERFIKIEGRGGKIILLPNFSFLKSKDAILILLLGYKAIKFLKLKEREAVGPKEIHEISDINLSTIKNALRDLETKRFASSKKGKYFVPNFILHLLSDYFLNLKLEKQKRSQLKRPKIIRMDTSRIEKILQSRSLNSFQKFYNFLIQEKGKYLSKCLIIIYVARENFHINSLTAGEITYILKNFLSVPMIHQSNITTALGTRSSSRFVFREKDERGKYSYKLNTKGTDFIKQLISEYESKRN